MHERQQKRRVTFKKLKSTKINDEEGTLYIKFTSLDDQYLLNFFFFFNHAVEGIIMGTWGHLLAAHSMESCGSFCKGRCVCLIHLVLQFVACS